MAVSSYIKKSSLSTILATPGVSASSSNKLAIKDKKAEKKAAKSKKKTTKKSNSKKTKTTKKTTTNKEENVRRSDEMEKQVAKALSGLTPNESVATSDEETIQKMITNTMNGVEGLPYQFMSSVDRRLTGTVIGRKYADKIISKLPLLFLTPCKQKFMDDFDDNDKSTAISMLAGQTEASNELINGKGKFYSVDFDYESYYQYLNCMLSSVAVFLGLQDQEVTINGKKQKLSDFSWQNETSDSFKSYFSSEENLVFYLDGLNQVSESYGNSTTESSLASTINGYADQANELRFLFGSSGGVAETLMNSATEVTSSISSALSGLGEWAAGGIVGALADKGVKTVLNGGKILFPEIWSDSSFDRSYSIDIKLRSPDHDSLSIYLNVLKPYCKLLCLTLPRLADDDPNGYGSPFLVKAYSKGMFNIDMGIIESMSVTKGAECCWNDDGLPTQIDISLSIKDLYSKLMMSGFDDKMTNVVSNTSYMDYLANMAGLNIAQMEAGRRIRMYYYLTKSEIKNIPSHLFTKFDQTISRLMTNTYFKL